MNNNQTLTPLQIEGRRLAHQRNALLQNLIFIEDVQKNGLWKYVPIGGIDNFTVKKVECLKHKQIFESIIKRLNVDTTDCLIIIEILKDKIKIAELEIQINRLQKELNKNEQ